MAIRLVVDTTCDILPNEVTEEFMEVMPLKIFIDGDEYLDGVTITREEFFDKLVKAKNLPKTVQINPIQFEEKFREILNQGDEVLGIFLSSKLSGTYNSARIAKDEINSEHIEIIDSTFTIMPFRLLVEEAVHLIKQGLPLKEIKEKLEIAKTKIVMLAFVSDLNYLRRGGRLSTAAFAIANVLHIKPILTMKDGEIIGCAKALGINKAAKAICKMVNEDYNVDYTRDSVIADAHGKAELEILRSSLYELTQLRPNIQEEIGGTTGTYTGPGCAAIAFFVK